MDQGGNTVNNCNPGQEILLKATVVLDEGDCVRINIKTYKSPSYGVDMFIPYSEVNRDLVITPENYIQAGRLALNMFAPGWVPGEYRFHYFRESHQLAVCGDLKRNNEPPGNYFASMKQVSCPTCLRWFMDNREKEAVICHDTK